MTYLKGFQHDFSARRLLPVDYWMTTCVDVLVSEETFDVLQFICVVNIELFLFSVRFSVQSNDSSDVEHTYSGDMMMSIISFLSCIVSLA